MGRMEDTVAIVTGAAHGIGRQIARTMAAEGARVTLTDIDTEAGAEVARQLEEDGYPGRFLEQDVSDEERWAEVIDDVHGRHGRVDVLVNNAGIYIIEELAKTSLEQWDQLMDINARGVFLGMKHAAPVMAEQDGGGAIVNMSSVAGLVGTAGHTLYGASKGAVRLMTKDAAAEFAEHGVRVNSVHPGYIDTQMAEQGAEAFGAEDADELGEMFPLGRIGTPEDVAQGVLYLASEEASFVTGTELVIDGGYTAS